MEAGKLRRPHRRRAFPMDELDNASAEDYVLFDDLRQVIADLQSLEGVHYRHFHGLGGHLACAYVVKELGEIVEELRKFVEQHRPIKVPRGRQRAHVRQPVGEDPVSVRTEEVP